MWLDLNNEEYAICMMYKPPDLAAHPLYASRAKSINNTILTSTS